MPHEPAGASDTVASGALGRAVTAVSGHPRDSARYTELGSAYLMAGQFVSASIAFSDAMELGDVSSRAVLGNALALAGAGHADMAAATLTEHQDKLASADLGLAFVLVGEPKRGLAILEGAFGVGENSAAVRQNLAFAYALSGRWREAQAMAQIDMAPAVARRQIAKWLETSAPDAVPLRIARMLGVQDARSFAALVAPPPGSHSALDDPPRNPRRWIAERADQRAPCPSKRRGNRSARPNACENGGGRDTACRGGPARFCPP